MQEKYRLDQYENVYEYSLEHNAYLFIGKLNGRTLSEFLNELAHTYTEERE